MNKFFHRYLWIYYYALCSITIQNVIAINDTIPNTFSISLARVKEGSSTYRSNIDRDIRTCEEDDSNDDKELYCRKINFLSDCFYHHLENNNNNDDDVNTVDLDSIQKYCSINPTKCRGDVEYKQDSELAFSDFFVSYAVKRQPLIINNIPDLIGDSAKTELLYNCMKEEIIEQASIKHNAFTTQYDIPDIFSHFKTIYPDESTFESTNTVHTTTNNDESGESYSHERETKNRFLDVMREDVCPQFSFKTDLASPKYVINHYFLRHHGKDEDVNIYENTFLKIMKLDKDDQFGYENMNCPASLNGLFMFYSKNGNDRQPSVVANARIYKSQYASTFDPVFIVNIQEFPFLSIEFNTYPWDDDDDDAPPKSFLQTSLDLGSALFVPSDSSVTFQKTIDEHSSDDDDDILLFRFCFLDASNLNKFKNHLQLESHLNEKSKELLQKISSPTFDLSMQKEVPTTLSFGWNASSNNSEPSPEEETPKTGNRRQRGKRRRGGSFAEWQLKKSWDHLVVGLTLPILPNPNILAHGRRNVTLTWPSSFSAKEEDSTRIGFLVTWEGQHDGDNDSVNNQLSGNMTFEEKTLEEIKAEDVARESSGRPKTFFQEIVTDKTSNTTFGTSMIKNNTAIIYGLMPDTFYLFRVAMYYGDGKNLPRNLGLFSNPSTIRTDKADVPFPISSTPYVLPPREWNRVLSYKDDNGKVKNFVPTFGSDATFVILEILAPYDDGGRDIIGYDIMRMKLDSLGRQDGPWTLLTNGVELLTGFHNKYKPGGLVRIGIHNLLPGLIYQFKVAARNDLGRSSWSESSGEVTTIYYSSCAAHETRRRRLSSSGAMNMESHGYIPSSGHQLFGRGTRILFTPQNHQSIGSQITLDDTKQTIHKENGQVVEVWSGFWSPRGFSVTAEVCEMIISIKQPNIITVTNEIDVTDRIVFVDRKSSTIPMVDFAMSAQRAGALGIIVIDDGQCSDYDQYCLTGASKQFGDYWAELDLSSVWEKLNIPVVFALKDTEHGSTRDWLTQV